MNFIDLCAGIGGFHQALRNMGMTCVLASDIDKSCREVYEANYHLKPEGDLTLIDIPSVPAFDVLCAGFPCQPFSKAGAQNGFDDDRGNVFFEICKFVEHHRPKHLILENVRNFASHDNGNTWSVLKKKIDELGYFTYEKPVILNTLYFGVPQSRERVVILCKRKDLGALPLLPEISKKNIRETNISSIVDESVVSSSKYYLSGKLKVTEKVWDAFLEILAQAGIAVPKFPIWTDWWDSEGNNTSITKEDKKKSDAENRTAIQSKQRDFYEKYEDWIDKNRTFYHENIGILHPWLLESRAKPEWTGAVRKMEWQTGKDSARMDNVLWSPRGSGVRIKNTDYSPTLVAMASMIPIYGPKSRQLTPRECARLQSFPDDFKIHEKDNVAYKQFGNAVNVRMIERSARFLIFNEDLF